MITVDKTFEIVFKLKVEHYSTTKAKVENFHSKMKSHILNKECSGSLVECLTRDRGAAGSSLTGVTALWSLSRHIYPSLVLVQPRKTRPCLTGRLLMGRKESNQTKQTKITKQLLTSISGDIRIYLPLNVIFTLA